MRHPVVLAATLFSILLPLCAEAPALDPSLDISQYAHTTWKVREGFGKGQIISIAQTPDGYLWLGTGFGLLRFDGVRNITWQPPGDQHLPSNSIYSLLSSRDGTLWIGTVKGLASWKSGKFTEYPELAGLAIFSLLEDREGTVWVGAIGFPPPGKLCAAHDGSVHCYGQDGSLGSGVYGLYEDGKGTLWVQTRTGVWRWKPGTAQFYLQPGEPSGWGAPAENSEGTLLFPLGSGIGRLVRGRIEPFPLPDRVKNYKPRKLLRDRDGGLWIGTLDRGLLHLHDGRVDVFGSSDGLSADNIYDIFEDREGDVWVATSDGLDRFRELAVATFTKKQGLSSAAVYSIQAASRGSLWLSTPGGLDRWHNGKIVASQSRGGELARSGASLFQDHAGRLWVFALREAGYLQNDYFTRVRAVPGGVVHSVAEDASDDLWIAYQEAGLIRLRDGKAVQQIPWAGLGHTDNAMTLAADPKGGLWLGFFNGGVAYFAGGSIRNAYTVADGLGAGAVNSLRIDQNRNLWAATEGGLSRLKDGYFATLNRRNGLPCDAVHWAIEDNDHSLWLYMPCGLVRIAHGEMDSWIAAAGKNQDSKQKIQFTLFDSSDGVRTIPTIRLDSEVTKTPDGKLWFSPWDGVSVVDPYHLPVNKIPPPVHVEQITADGKTYDASNGLSLPARVRDLTIDYTALSLVAPEKIHFRYKLEGQDPDWREVVNDRRAVYSNLAPRHYTFRVMACNNSGMWNEAGATLDFVIPPAWYQTKWFRALCVLAFLGLVYGAYRVRVAQLRAQEQKFREAIESIPAMAFVSLPDGYRTFVNKGWVEYTGMTVGQSLGSGWHAAIHPEDLKRVLGRWEAALTSGKSVDYEARYRRAEDGQYRWFMVRVVPQRNKRGKIVKWYGTASDMEDRKRAEELQSQLAHVNRVSMMGELSASLSHELKQPIAAAVISANTALRTLNRDEPDLERVRETTARIVKYGNRAADIIDRLRSLYRKTPLKYELVDVNEVIGEMAGLLRGEANRYGVSIRTDVAADLPKVMADRVQIQQVLMNLTLNAIEAMNETGGVLTVKSQLGEQGRVMISVSDTGVGLPADKADEIFKAFVTTKPQGSGMGLAISRSIVESYCGRLWATANDGRGATFHFTLQIQRTEPTPSVVQSDVMS